MGAATALYSATCFAIKKYGDGTPYPSNLSAVVGLSGWLPCSKFGFSHYSSSQFNPSIFFCSQLQVLFLFRTLSKKFEEASEAARRAASFPLLLCHGKGVLHLSCIYIMSLICFTNTSLVVCPRSQCSSNMHTTTFDWYQVWCAAGDDVVPYKFGEQSSRALSSTGFQEVTFKSYNGYVVWDFVEKLLTLVLSRSYRLFCSKLQAWSLHNSWRDGWGLYLAKFKVGAWRNFFIVCFHEKSQTTSRGKNWREDVRNMNFFSGLVAELWPICSLRLVIVWLVDKIHIRM